MQCAPDSKAKVESCVLIIERYLLGRLRRRAFYSLAELNHAIREMLADINRRRPLRRLGVTRQQLFEELDRPALKPLPAEPYVYAEWRVRRAGLDYHVEVEDHYYSVPYRFAKDELEVRLTARTVEVFRKGERIAAHLRSSGNRRHTTIPEHMPSSHRHFADWSIERIRREASAVGRSTAALCEVILEERRHPEQGFRACLGIVRLAKSFGRERVEAACLRALEIGARSYGSVRSILDNKLDRQAASKHAADCPTILHPNIRGPRYYN
jgi:transposase